MDINCEVVVIINNVFKRIFFNRRCLRATMANGSRRTGCIGRAPGCCIGKMGDLLTQ